MSVLFSATNPRIEAIQIEIIRRMPAWKKIAIVDGLIETVKTLAISAIQEETHKEFSQRDTRGYAVLRNPG
jgi:hypothetical protein